MIFSLLFTILKIIFYVYTLATIICSAVAVNQERKLWAPASMPSLSALAMFKVFVFNIIWIGACTTGCIIIWIQHILSGGKTDIQHKCNTVVERSAAMACMRLIGEIELKGEENLPPDDKSVPAPVYIANHASQIDLGAVYAIKRRFKWIAKESVLYVPGVGVTMYTGDHVLINRVKGKNKSSVSTLFEKSNAAVQAGIPMFLFPQGTRVMHQRLPFKDGAFIIAQANKSQLVPISLEIPKNAWETLYPFGNVVPKIVLTVHKPVEVTGEEDRQELKQRCSDIIYSVLPGNYETVEETPKDKKREEGKKNK